MDKTTQSHQYTVFHPCNKSYLCGIYDDGSFVQLWVLHYIAGVFVQIDKINKNAETPFNTSYAVCFCRKTRSVTYFCQKKVKRGKCNINLH